MRCHGGEEVDARSDIDVLVVIEHAGWDAAGQVLASLHQAAREVARLLRFMPYGLR